MLSVLKGGGTLCCCRGHTHSNHSFIHSFMSTEELGASSYRGGSLAFRFPSRFLCWGTSFGSVSFKLLRFTSSCVHGLVSLLASVGAREFYRDSFRAW